MANKDTEPDPVLMTRRRFLGGIAAGTAAAGLCT